MAKDDKSKKADEKPAEEASPEEQAKKKKKRLIIFGAVGFLALAGIAVAVALFLGKGGDKAKTVSADEVAAEGEGHGEAKGEAKGEGHGEAKGEAKGEGHGGGEKKDAKGGGHGGGEKKDAKGEGHGGGEKKEAKGEGHGGGEKKDAKGEGHGGGEAKGGEKKDAKGEDEGAASEYGEVFALKPFNLNLGNALENRFIRIEVGLQYSGAGEQKRELEAKTPRIRDVIGTIVGRKTREFLLMRDGKAQLRKEIFLGVNEFLKTPIQDVFITDMMIE